MDIIMILKAVVLGVVEGITEFVPVSSTGHLIIAEHFLKLSTNEAFIASFEVIIQLGAILAIIVLFWNTLWPFSGTPEKRKDTWKLWGKVALGVIPAFVLGILFDDIIEEKLFNPLVVTITLVFYGIVLLVVEFVLKGKKRVVKESLKELTIVTALLIGLFQCLSMIPGTSRSAATIIGGMILGLSRGAAAEYSFFMAIPIMVGASAVKIVKDGLSFSAAEWITVGVGFVVSFITALLVVRLFLNYIRKKDFKPFGVYRIIVGIAVLVILQFLG